MCCGQSYLRAFAPTVPSVPKALPPSLCLLVPQADLSSNITTAEALPCPSYLMEPLSSITLSSYSLCMRLALYIYLLECMLCYNGQYGQLVYLIHVSVPRIWNRA